MKGDDIQISDIIDELERNNINRLNHTENVLTTVTETLDFVDVARLNAIAGAIDLQKLLTENGINEEITVSLMPYEENYTDMVPWKKIGIISSKLYKGNLGSSYILSIIPPSAKSPIAIKLTGKEIKDLANNGLDKSSDLGYDSNHKPYPFVIVTKNDIALDDNKTYVVAINASSLTNEMYNKLKEENKILSYNVDDEIKYYTANLQNGLYAYFENHKNISPSTIKWE